MVNSLFFDEEGAESPDSSRRSRVEWKLRKGFDYAGHRREMVQSFRDAEKFFKENLQFPKQRRRESASSSQQQPGFGTTAEQRQRESDECDADVHQNLGTLVTPAGGGFGPGYGANSLKRTLEEKKAARDRLVQLVHNLEGYAATPGVIATVDPESGRVRAVEQSQNDMEQLKSTGHRAPFVNKARLFPPLRIKTIPSSNIPPQKPGQGEGVSSSARERSLQPQTQQPADARTLTLVSEENDDLKQHLTNLGNTSSPSTIHQNGLPPNSTSRLSAVSVLSKKIANQQTPTPLPPIGFNNQSLTTTQSDQFLVSLVAPRAPLSTSRGAAKQDPSSSPRRSLANNEGATTAAPTLTTTTTSVSALGGRGGVGGGVGSLALDELFSTARNNLRNAPVASAYHPALHALGVGGGAARTRGSSRQTSRVASRKTSFVAANAGTSMNINNSNSNVANSANLNDYGALEFGSGTSGGTMMLSMQNSGGGAGIGAGAGGPSSSRSNISKPGGTPIASSIVKEPHLHHHYPAFENTVASLRFPSTLSQHALQPPTGFGSPTKSGGHSNSFNSQQQRSSQQQQQQQHATSSNTNVLLTKVTISSSNVIV